MKRLLRVSMSPRERRVVYLGALCIAAALAVGRGLPAWRSWVGEQRATASELRLEVRRAEASIRAHEARRDSLLVLEGELRTLGRLTLSARTAAAAGTELASLVNEAARAAGVSLGALHVTGDSAGVTIRRVRLRVEGSGDVRALVGFLLALERGAVSLRVVDLSVAQPDPAAAEHVPEALALQLTVDAPYIRAQETTPDA